MKLSKWEQRCAFESVMRMTITERHALFTMDSKYLTAFAQRMRYEWSMWLYLRRIRLDNYKFRKHNGIRQHYNRYFLCEADRNDLMKKRMKNHYDSTS